MNSDDSRQALAELTELQEDEKPPEVRVIEDEEQRVQRRKQTKDAILEKRMRPFFHRRKVVEDVDCGQLAKRNGVYVAHLLAKRGRISSRLKDDAVSSDCPTILSRTYFPLKPLSQEEAEYPIAYIRIVYQEYVYLEQELGTSYAPQNSYCYVVDSKSPPIFHEHMKNLSDCLPNVHIARTNLDINSRGYNMIKALTSCMQLLLKFPGWRYVVNLQNYDIVLRTNWEMVRILKTLGGANDVDSEDGARFTQRIDSHFSWTVGNLQIFSNESVTDMLRNETVPFAKGQIHSSLSREAVEFMFNEINVIPFMERLNRKYAYGHDELFFATLNTWEELGMPGGFTRKCWNGSEAIRTVTSLVQWRMKGPACPTRVYRHGICIWGVENFPDILEAVEISYNKMIPYFDYALLSCTLEEVHNRTYGLSSLAPPFNESVYSDSLLVRYHRARQRPDFDLEEFEC